MAVSLVQGMHYGLQQHSINVVENSVRAGRGTVFTAIFQSCQVVNVMTVVEKVFALRNLPFLSNRIQWALYLTPVAIVVAGAQKIKNETAKQILLAIQDNFGAFCNIALAVSSIAMIYFGNAPFGIASLISIVIGILDRQGILPENQRHLLHKFLPVILAITGLLVATDLLSRVISLIVVLGFVAEKVLPNNSDKVVPALKETKFLTKKQFIQLTTNPHSHHQLKVRESHLDESLPLITPPDDVDISILEKIYSQVEWSQKNIMSLRNKLSEDDKFTTDHVSVNDKTDEFLIEYAKKGLETLIKEIKAKHIPDGEPPDYDRLTSYLELIAMALQKESNENVKFHRLLKLTVEAGLYCGPGKYEAIEDLYADSVYGMPLTTRIKTLFSLHELRLCIFKKAYSKNSLKCLHSDLHAYNQQLNILEGTYKLDRAGARNDSVALIDFASKKILGFFYSLFHNKFFKKEYAVDPISKHFQDTFGASHLPKPLFYNWLKSRKEIIPEDFDYTSCENKNGKIDARFIRVFLVDQGILEFKI